MFQLWLGVIKQIVKDIIEEQHDAVADDIEDATIQTHDNWQPGLKSQFDNSSSARLLRFKIKESY